jgi:putative DNA primase/helicase
MYSIKKQTIKLLNLPLTDYGNAQRLKLIFGNRWVYLPRYKNWVFYDEHCWRGKKTIHARWAAADAFSLLAKEIYRLPAPPDEYELDKRVRAIAWLTKSQLDYHVNNAVNFFKEMCLNEQIPI